MDYSAVSVLELDNGFVLSLLADVPYYYSSNSGLFKRLNCFPGEAMKKNANSACIWLRLCLSCNRC